MYIKSIPTEFKGVRFRSRLEARWAAFFEALNFDWRYEHEPVVVEEATELAPNAKTCVWLPDFWLADVNLYIEIKPTEEEAAKCSGEIDGFNIQAGYHTNLWATAREKGEEYEWWKPGMPAAIVLFGEPRAKKHGIITTGVFGDGGGFYTFNATTFAVCRRCSSPAVYLYLDDHLITIRDGGHEPGARCGDRWPIPAEEAYKAAQLQWFPKKRRG